MLFFLGQIKPIKNFVQVIGGLLAVNAQQPLFLLSKSQGPVHMGVAYIPKVTYK